MIGIWYNPKTNNFYSKHVTSTFFLRHYCVGYVNQYNHKLVALFNIVGKDLIQCNSIGEYYNYMGSLKNSANKHKLKKRIISYLINLLNK